MALINQLENIQTLFSSCFCSKRCKSDEFNFVKRLKHIYQPIYKSNIDNLIKERFLSYLLKLQQKVKYSHQSF